MREFLDPLKIQILKEIIKLFNTTSESKLPDNFLDVINKIEIDRKAEKILKQEAEMKKESVFIFFFLVLQTSKT